MSITALMWVSLYASAIVLALLSNPLFGVLGYLLEYYMRPELKWWGDELPSLRYNLIISMVLGLSFMLQRSNLPKMADTPNPARRWLLSLAAIMLFVTATMAVNRTVSWGWVLQWSKMAIIFPMLVYACVRSRQGFNAFVSCHILGAFWWGWEAYDDPKRIAGRLVNIGSGDSLDDNTASAHLLTVLPFIAIFCFTEKDKRLRTIALIAAPFVINTLILCNSRGSMVGLLAALGAAFFLVKTGYRGRMVGVGVLALAGFLLLADQTFIDRQQTTAEYEEDGSARQRLETWQGAAQLVKDHPLGTGGRGFHFLSPIYIPSVVFSHGGDLRAPHNTYAMVASEWGIAGLVCYLGFYFSTIAMLQQAKRRARPEEQGFYYWRAFAIQIAIIAFMVAGTFSDRLYAEAGYWMFGLASALCRIQKTEQEASEPQAQSVVAAEPAAAAFGRPLAEARPR